MKDIFESKKVETSALIGFELDWAVAQCLDVQFVAFAGFAGRGKWAAATRYSIIWQQGGPILDREQIGVQCCYESGEHCGWMADSKKLNHEEDTGQFGPTILIAGLRYFVASKMGDHVDIPWGVQCLELDESMAVQGQRYEDAVVAGYRARGQANLY
jgi:hypothetical protein